MGLFSDLWDNKKKRDACCANCSYFDVNRRICKKGMSYRNQQLPHEPCDCPKFSKRVF